MASRIRHKVELVFGWLFVVVVIAALCGAIYVATQPMDMTNHAEVRHAR
jgi:hypothetical protein